MSQRITRAAVGRVEYWLTPDGFIVETHQNPCGCHPLDFIISNGPKYGGFSFSFRSRRSFRRYVNDRRWEKLT